MLNNIKIRLPSPYFLKQLINYLLISITFLLIIWKGPNLFKDTSAPSTFKTILIVLTTLLFIIMLFITFRSKGNTLITAILRSIVILITAFGLTFLIGNAFKISLNPEISNFLEQGDQLLHEGEFSGALVLGEKCVQNSKEPQDIMNCKRLEAEACYGLGKEEVKQGDCSSGLFTLNRGLQASNVVGDQDLTDKIAQIIETYKNHECKVEPSPTPAPTPTPVPDSFALEVLRAREGSKTAILDLRVLNNNVYMSELTKEAFQLINVNDEKVPFDFERKSADDPVCVVAVIDNSGSIEPWIDDMKNAVLTMNSMRKPDDRYGLVIFSDEEKTLIAQSPKRADLNINAIDGSGGETALWLGMELGFEALKTCGSDMDRHLILITDGSNTEPYLIKSTDEVIKHFKELAINEEVKVCPIGVKSKYLRPEQLGQLAEGCSYEEVSDTNAISSKISSIIGYVRDFYRLSFSVKELAVSDVVTLQLIKDGQPVGEKIDVEFDD